MTTKDAAGQTLDLDTFVRAMLDSRRAGTQPDEATNRALQTAIYLRDRGVQVARDGALWDPSGVSLNSFYWDCKKRGLLDEEAK